MTECRYPNKGFYLTRADARAGAETIRQRVEARGDQFSALYPYKCPSREHWHLSSSRQGRVACPDCRQVNLPAWFDTRTQAWVVYAHGECATKQVVRR